MLKRILMAVAAIMLALPFLGMQETQAATNDTAEILLHKRIFSVNGNDGTQYENDGLLKDPSDAMLAKTVGVNDVEFAVYNATGLLEAALAEKQTVEEFVRDYTALEISAAQDIAQDLDLVGSGNAGTGRIVTQSDNAISEDGIGRITLPQRQNNHVAAYYIIETGHQAEVDVDVAAAAPLMVVMNVRHPQTDAVLNTLHIYPKNDAYARDPWFFKFGVTTSGDKVRLEGVEYVISKAGANGQRLYLGHYTPGQVVLNWVTSTNPKTDQRLAVFTSDKNGLVATPDLYLKSGDYQFNEIKALPGYILDNKPVTIEVSDRMYDEDGNYLWTLVNGEQIYESPTGILPDNIIEAGKPRVYNYAEQTPTTPTDPAKPAEPEVPTTSTKKPTPSGILPQLGNGWSIILIIAGLVIMAWVTIWWRMRSKNIRNFK